MPQHYPDGDIAQGVDQLRCGGRSHEKFSKGAGVGEGGGPFLLVVVDDYEEHHEEANKERDVSGHAANALGVLGCD